MRAPAINLWFPENPIWLIDWELTLFRRFSPALVVTALFTSVLVVFRSRAVLQLEILALRHQLGVLQRSVKRPTLTAADRFLWAQLCQFWKDWRSALVVVKPETVIGWHRKGFGCSGRGRFVVVKPGVHRCPNRFDN